MGDIIIERSFVRIAEGSIHFRSAGTNSGGRPPLLMLHGGPGSSAGLEAMIVGMAQDVRVIAPDMMGCGNSDPPPAATTEITFYAETLQAALSSLDLDVVDIYGHHTGAQVACEFAISSPDRVRRLVLDGVALFPLAQRDEFFERYAPPLDPVESGAHMAWVWDFVGNLTRYFPHYKRNEGSAIRPGMILSPAIRTSLAGEILQNCSTFHLSYVAAFRHDVRQRLPHVAASALVLETIGDPLSCYAKEAAGLLPKGRVKSIQRSEKIAQLRAFLA